MRCKVVGIVVAAAVLVGLINYATQDGGGDEDVMEALASLAVVDSRPERSGYDRGCGKGDGCVFGPRWKDVDRNGCDQRNDTLARDLDEITTKPGTRGCKVLTGTLTDPYTGNVVQFNHEDAAAVPIDHIVALKPGWDYGAADWDLAKREQFANDLDNLVPTQRAINSDKSDKTPADWRPASKADQCDYATRYVTVVSKYDLPVSKADHTALAAMINKCPYLPTADDHHHDP